MAHSLDEPEKRIPEPPRGFTRRPILFFVLLTTFVVWVGVMIWMWSKQDV